MPRTAFLSTGFHVPARVVTNDDLAKIMDTSDEWIVQRTGIKTRYWVDKGDTGVALAREASKKALDKAGLAPADIDCIIYCTCTPDHFEPGNGVFLQRELGLSDIPAVDVRNQCSGFIYGLSIADAWIRTGQYKNILLVGAEVHSRGLDKTTRGRDTAVLFGDGAGAAVLGPISDDGRGVLSTHIFADGRYAEKLWVDGPGLAHDPYVSVEMIEQGLHRAVMEGRDVFKFASLTSSCSFPIKPTSVSSRWSRKRRGSATIRSTATSKSTATPPRPRFRSRSMKPSPRGDCSGATCSY